MVETAEAKQVSRAASSMLVPELDFGIADNGTYPSEDFQSLRHPGLIRRVAPAFAAKISSACRLLHNLFRTVIW
jgi:hypothetical protein